MLRLTGRVGNVTINIVITPATLVGVVTVLHMLLPALTEPVARPAPSRLDH